MKLNDNTRFAGWALSLGVAAGAMAPAAALAFAPSAFVQEDEEGGLDPELLGELDALLDQGREAVTGAADELYDRVIEVHGGIDELAAHLAGLAGGDTPAARDARRLLGLVQWRHGELNDALRSFKRLVRDDDTDLGARLAKAQLLDAIGSTKTALAEYGALVDGESFDLDADLETRLRLRMALISMATGGEEQKDALAAFAREPGRPVALRNRCATVLALLGRPGDAADLYVVTELAPDDAPVAERKKARKAAANGELRVAEWALRAEDFPRAQGAAWRAMELATVTREVRYALTLLAEAHRGDDTLPALLTRFSEERAALPSAAREAWIELLRETGSTDEAIAMSQAAGAEEFSAEERRRLLEMYREAGRTDEMVAVYRELIAAEPAELVWRSGLSRYFLEVGDREAARDVWGSWFDLAERGEGGTPLDAADALSALGLDQLAMDAAELAIATDRMGEAAFLFLYDLHRDRGRLDEARTALERLDGYAAPGAPARMPLSDCFERLGDLERAVDVLEGVRAARGVGDAGEDLEMRLAWLYSEVGDEEKALELWRDLWTRVKSAARRRFVEDRLMTVASRLGVLADIAVDLERKLFAGEADQRDSGLLVRLYTSVGDAVSAAEIIDEFLRQSGGTELEALTEKARIYLACNDYYHYEKTVAKLIEIDPEGKPDYFRQLAMSQLERGKPDQARSTLMKLQELPGGDDSSAEFEAGVLALSGMREEAISAYRRGLAAHPERIDSYLLMANLLKETRETDLAVGMFQHLAETAERDDLFTIAIDGLLNMLVDAPPRPGMTAWARRVTLERLAATEDRPYLYQLLADLAEETNDYDGQIAALENSLAAAGPRRASVLRELMELSKPARGGFNQPARKGDRARQLAFGRRLVGLAELVPPDVYLDLGDAFLEEDDEDSAARTFDLTREFPDGEVYQQLAAERFEKAGFVERALDRYRAVLAASPTDVKLLAKVGELEESLGDDAAAFALYRRGYGTLLARKPLFEGGKDADDEEDRWRPRNVDAYDQTIERILQGLLATLPDGEAVRAFLREERAALAADLPAALELSGAVRAEGDDPAPLAQHPRITARAGLIRRVAFATGNADEAWALDQALMAAFPADVDAVEGAVQARVKWGRYGEARRLVGSADLPAGTRDELMAGLGDGGGAGEGGGGSRIPFDSAVAAVLPTLASGDIEGLRTLVRRADLTAVEKGSVGRMAVLFAGARATGDDQLVLSVARDWLRMQLDGGTSSYAIESNLESLLGTVDDETGLALARYFVGRVLEEPEENSQYVTVLPKLSQRFGDAVVEKEEVLTLLDGFGSRFAYGLGPVLSLLPSADQASALRGIWSKLEASSRAGFLIDLVTEAQDDVGEELGAFIVESLPDAMGEAEDFIQYSIGQLGEVEHSRALCARMIDVIVEARPDFAYVEAFGLIHRAELDGADRAALGARAAEVWIDLALADAKDYRRRTARRAVVEAFGETSGEAFFAALDARAGEEGMTMPLRLAKVDLALDLDDDGVARRAIDEGLEEDPESLELLERRRRLERSGGDRVAAARTLERIVELEKDESKRERNLKTLAREWKALHAPELALAARRELSDEDDGDEEEMLMAGAIMLPGGVIMMGPGGGEPPGDKGLPKSFKDVREALEEGDVARATRIFRRVWRRFPEGQPQTPRFFSSFSYRALPLASLSWPAEEPEDGGDDEEPRRGGYLSFEPEEPEPGPEPPSAYARIGEVPELVAEQRRFLRTVRAHELDRLQPMLEGLLSVDIEAAEGGADEVLGGLLARVDAGETGRADQIALLALLDRFPDRVTGAAADAVATLVRTMPPRDAVQVRRLARVLLQSGREDTALALYRWCALMASASSPFSFGDDESTDVVTSVSDRQLVKEARDHLEGDAKIALIESVLDAARPASNGWMQESYEALVLNTWSEVVPAAEAVERSRAVLDDVMGLGSGLRRDSALLAACMYAEAGERERALRALEIGIAKLDPSEVTQPEERWFREDPTRPGRLRVDTLRRLFPPAGGELPEARAWFVEAASALSAWLEDDRLDAASSARGLALLSIRLTEVGATDEGLALARALLGRRDEGDGISAGNALWVIDALRVAGAGDEADAWERELLAEGQLQAERIADLVERILPEEGVDRALELCGGVLEVSRHERLLGLLADALEAAGRSEEAAEWRSRSQAARAAEEALAKLEAKK